MSIYAFITGDEYTKFEPIAFVYDDGKYEVVCQSFDRQKSWYTYLAANKNLSFESFLTRFSYQDVNKGEVTPEIETVLNGLRVQFATEHLAEAEKNQTSAAPDDLYGKLDESSKEPKSALAQNADKRASDFRKTTSKPTVRRNNAG
jgi:hypothetical protein